MSIRGVLRRLAAPRSSIADVDSYLDVCAAAARDERVFARFKRHPGYTAILEHTSREQGAACLEILRAEHPHLLGQLDAFRGNDRLGEPVTYDFGDAGLFSPSTLRYVKILGDMQALFGPLGELDVVEIGGGYGGQCAVAAAGGGFRSWTLIDLEAPLRLAERYLERLGVERVRCATMQQLGAGERWDLLVSNYAFTECTRPVQEIYLERVLQRCPRGFMICNAIAPERFRAMSRDELLERLDGAEVLDERPLTHRGNHVLAWGHRR